MVTGIAVVLLIGDSRIGSGSADLESQNRLVRNGSADWGSENQEARNVREARRNLNYPNVVAEKQVLLEVNKVHQQHGAHKSVIDYYSVVHGWGFFLKKWGFSPSPSPNRV
ncbi:hypothetical protein TNIN_299861 [Trichonephila inaurata madagascariensis]|uniref:Uncharacterized protein n=1 Tax=Trichonephila inaurata madagascariensis TaxID=2747483 RepID=A0A8X6XB83_9ARAC|nr:hypothetical protein TNIN_299861 [Trichonephila inaurata madagascariensis]